MLSDVVAGKSDLAAIIRTLGANEGGRDIPALATPVYSKGAHKPELIAQSPQETGCLFVVELGRKTVRINGVEVVAAQARTAHGVMRLLVTAFVQDLLVGNAPSGFLCQSPAEITDQLKKDNCITNADHEDVIRRTINRLQENFETRLRKAGVAAERDSVIQVSPNVAKEGYRLNPLTVAIRPLCAADPQN
jgi:hypothetical protein